MRCFIGVSLPKSVIDVLVRVQDHFSSFGRMTLVKPEQMHVSIHFLGDVSPELVIDELSSVSFNPFKASLNGLSFFFDNHFIRVIHSPVIKGEPAFQELYQKVIVALGLKPVRFTPHATLARVKFVKDKQSLINVCVQQQFEVDFNVSSFNLYSSFLTPKGPVYEVIKQF